MRVNPTTESLDRIADYIKTFLNTSIPAYVKDFDIESRTCTAVVPFSDFMESDSDEPTNLDWTPIPDVPVFYLRGGGWSDTFELKKNDPILLIFSQRSIDEWFASDGKSPITPALQETHSESDCFALAGLFPTKNKDVPFEAGKRILAHENGLQLVLDSSGKASFVADRLNIGSESATTALAKGQVTTDQINALKTRVDTLSAILSLPPVILTGTINSTKAFTND